MTNYDLRTAHRSMARRAQHSTAASGHGKADFVVSAAQRSTDASTQHSMALQAGLPALCLLAYNVNKCQMYGKAQCRSYTGTTLRSVFRVQLICADRRHNTEAYTSV